MPPLFYEAEDSRNDLEFGAQGGGLTLRFHSVGTDDEAAIYASALANSPGYLLGFIRQNIGVERIEALKYKANVRYGTTGLGGGDVPTGAGTGGTPEPEPPKAPESAEAALGAGYEFSTTGATVHITQSLETKSSTRRGAAPGAPGPDYKRAIGVTKGRVEGTDVPAPSLRWSRTVARPSVSRAYIQLLKSLTGKLNDAEFYGSPAGSVRYLGGEGRFTTGEGWSVTHHFEEGEAQNEPFEICEGLTVPGKGAWEYLWVAYAEDIADNEVAPLPEAALVEKVSEWEDFSAIGIGTTYVGPARARPPE